MNSTAASLDLDPPVKAASHRSSRLRLAARIAVSMLGCAATLAVAGLMYEQIASRGDAATYPPVGELIDIGGYRLHLDCRGEGAPAIILDAGLGGSSLDWSLVQPQLAEGTRVCSYDRAGMGWSDPGPNDRSPAMIAEELHRLLTEANVPGPYVLVGHSLAGKNLRMFARAYPSEVAGMVLVDTRSEAVDMQLSDAQVDGFRGALSGQALLFTLARNLGAVRLIGGPVLIGEPLVSPALAQEMALFATSPNAVAATTAEGLARSANDDELAQSTLGDMPLAVIAARASMKGIAGWPMAQQALAALSSKGSLVIADTGHPVPLEAPDLVIDAVQSVLAEARRSDSQLSLACPSLTPMSTMAGSAAASY